MQVVKACKQYSMKMISGKGPHWRSTKYSLVVFKPAATRALPNASSANFTRGQSARSAQLFAWCRSSCHCLVEEAKQPGFEQQKSVGPLCSAVTCCFRRCADVKPEAHQGSGHLQVWHAMRRGSNGQTATNLHDSIDSDHDTSMQMQMQKYNITALCELVNTCNLACISEMAGWHPQLRLLMILLQYACMERC